VLAEFPEYLTEAQRVPDTLAELGKLTLKPEANIIKLPNISASVAQLKACIKELQGKGYAIPTTRKPQDRRREGHPPRYGKCIGSAVNPVLREGNSDRRAPRPSRNTPARTRTAWPSGARPRARTSRTCTMATSTTAKSR
jgi:isocitrate dehydrogenase